MYFNYGEATIHYKIFGHGFPIVLLHGFLESSTMWNPLIATLLKKNQVIIIDFPGFGKSECLTKSHTMEALAEVVFAILNELKIKKIHLVGHSMGGYVSLAFLEKYGNKVSQITLLNSTTKADSLERKINRERAIKLVLKNKNAFINMAIRNLFTSPAYLKYQGPIQELKKEALNFSICGIINALIGMKKRKDRTKILANYSGKKTIIGAINDTLISIEESINISKITQSKLIKIEGGHMSLIEEKNTIIKLF
ncbi:MAG: alpha/beta fold hydrolase [Flavobacteriales bacterium]